MSEIYSNGEIALIYIIISIFSIGASLVYLFWHIDYKKLKWPNWPIFILCFIYTTLFVFLVLIAMFDLVFNNQKGFSKFSNVISKYYDIFDYIDKILGYIVFPIIIYYLESGHFTIFRKLLDGLIGIAKEFVEALIWSFRILLFIALLVILIKYRKHFGIDNFLDYIFVILDCNAIFDIYICVGFFMVQTIIDCKRYNNTTISKRYRNYSSVKIIEKTDKYICKMNDLSKGLKKTIQNYPKDKSSSEYINAENTLIKIEDKLNEYESESNVVITIDNLPEQKSSVINVGADVFDKNYLDALNNGQNNKVIETNKDCNLNAEVKQEEINNKIEEQKEEPIGDPVECHKKSKKYIRRINKLKLLYKEIQKEKVEKEEKEEKKTKVEKEEKEVPSKNKTDENLENKTTFRDCCGDIVLIISYFIAVLSDFLLPIFLQHDENYIEEETNYEKEKSTFALLVGVIVAILLSLVCNAYTVIVIYATKRKRYITGDYLYDKKINDNLNLLKTVQIICGYSFSLVYCNLYYWTTLDKKSVFGIPLFRRQIIIPDYTIKYGISVFMIIKLVIIIVSMVFTFVVCNKISIFKNDLAEYNCSGSKYDSDDELNKVKNERRKTFYFLEH